MGYFHGQLGRKREDRGLIWEVSVCVWMCVCDMSLLALDRLMPVFVNIVLSDTTFDCVILISM